MEIDSRELYAQGRISLSKLGEASLTSTRQYFLSHPEIIKPRYKEITGSDAPEVSEEELVEMLIASGEEFNAYNPFSLLRDDQIPTNLIEPDRYKLLRMVELIRIPSPPPSLDELENFESLPDLFTFGISRGIDLRALSHEVTKGDLEDYLKLVVLYPKHKSSAKPRRPTVMKNPRPTDSDQVLFEAYQGKIYTSASSEMIEIAKYPPEVPMSEYQEIKQILEGASLGVSEALFILRIDHDELFQLTRGYPKPT